jgi:hypothetical protein
VSLPIGHAALTREMARLDPYARQALERAADFALWLHADEVSVEHLLASLLQDEECGASRLVLHAFADPQSLVSELMALAPGILVVASGGSLPFSVRGLRALERARAAASPTVEPLDVFRAASTELPEALQADLRAVGMASDPGERAASAAGPGPEETFFGPFSNDGRRALSAACKTALRLGRRAISPAHLMIGALECGPTVADQAGLSAGRLRLLVTGREADETPLVDRVLEPDAGLLELLGSLPAGGGSTDILGGILRHGREDLRALLARQKITPALHERVAGAFRDPPPS